MIIKIIKQFMELLLKKRERELAEEGIEILSVPWIIKITNF